MALALAVALSGCTGSQGHAPSREPYAVLVTPEQLTLRSGDQGQLAAQVNDSVGQPIGGADIRYAVADPRLLRITRTGLVTAVGPAPGDTTVVVSSGGRQRRIPVHVLPGPPQRVEIEGGDKQLVRAGESAAQALSARVLDAYGNPVPDVTAVFEPSPAAFAARSVSTGAEGGVELAVPVLTAAGAVSIAVRVNTPAAPSATFALTVLPAAPAAMELVSSGSTVRTATVGTTVEIRVNDRFGNPVPEVALNVRAGKAGSTQSVRTNEQGIASITLPPKSKARHLTIRAETASSPVVHASFTIPADR